MCIKQLTNTIAWLINTFVTNLSDNPIIKLNGK